MQVIDLVIKSLRKLQPSCFNAKISDVAQKKNVFDRKNNCHDGIRTFSCCYLGCYLFMSFLGGFYILELETLSRIWQPGLD